MKNKITSVLFFLFVFACFYANESKAQYSFSPSTTIVKYQNRNSLSYDSIHIANNSNDTLRLHWKLILNDTMGGSYFDFCSTGNCWLGIPASGSFPAIKPGGFGYAGAHFWTANLAVTSTAKIFIYKEGFPTIGDTLTYILHTVNGSGIDTKDEAENLISVYPNPASDRIRISCQNTEIGKTTASFCNMNGAVIFTISSLKALTEIPLDNFAEGIYFITVNFGNRKSVKKIIVSR
ncbi:MAG: T9SS type A sorting domain-containing protein [Bacteroidota bacterium]